jgi:hypothetical protein
MPTADAMREKALTLIQTDTRTDDAVQELLDHCQQRRVPVVLARQQFLRDLEESPSDDVARRAVELLDQVLGRLPMD